MQCSKCRKLIKLGDSVDHDCGHRSHTLCMSDNPPDKEFEKCFACRGEQIKLPIDEPTTYEGNDWIKNPDPTIELSPVIDQIFAKCNSVEDIVLGQDLPLQRLLCNGVTIDTFVKHGFGWDELKKFKDLSQPGERRIAALFALRTTAEHFHRHPKLLPVKEMGLNAGHMINDFGLYFPENRPLMTYYGKNDIPWTLADLAKLGVKSDDLWRAGLKSRRQYEDLCPSRAQIEQMFPQTKNAVVRRYEKEEEQPVVIEDELKYLYVKPKRHGLKKRP